MSHIGMYLSFPAVLITGMERAALIRTQGEAALVLNSLANRGPKGPVASLSQDALCIPIWGGKYAGRESRFALECAKQLNEILSGTSTDVVMSGNSAALSQGYGVESSCTRDGWHLYNIFSLPYTLESAVAHAVAVAVSARGARLTVAGGDGAGLSALQFVQNVTASDPLRTVIWGGAEQLSDGVAVAMGAENRTSRSRCDSVPHCHFEGSVLISVTSAPTRNSVFQVVELCDIKSSHIPEDIVFGARQTNNFQSHLVIYTNSMEAAAHFSSRKKSNDVIHLGERFGDGWSLTSFLPFVHMFTQPMNRDFVILLSNGHGRWQLLRGIMIFNG